MTPGELANARALYAGQVTLVDRWVGQLLELAERLGLMKNTVIIWTTDHGHLFGEHDLQGKPGAEMGRLYEITTHIPLLVHHPEGLGAGQRVQGIVQPTDILPSVLEFYGMSQPEYVQGRSFWPLLGDGTTALHDYAFSNRFPPTASDPTYTPTEGAVFDGWVGSDRIVEPSTVTDGRWAYICAPQGLPSELYDLEADPGQEHNVIDEHQQVAKRMYDAWIAFLKESGASDARIRPFVDAHVDVHIPTSGKLFAFRDDQGQWIAFSTEREARLAAYRKNAPGTAKEVREVTFGQMLDDNPRNLVHLNDQYYWASDLA
jgi:arylsulfatase A-like enzyme